MPCAARGVVKRVPRIGAMPTRPLLFHGQPAIEAVLDASGDRVVVALQGAQVLSWTTADGTERLYLSPQAVFDGRTAIRGGVPVCFPQFNQRGPLPKHGFARNLPWQAVAPEAGGDTLVLRLADDAATRRLWPEAFEARLRIGLAPGRLRIGLEVRNPGPTPWSFTAALHTYLRVDDATALRLEGLQGRPRWDAVRDERFVEPSPALRFGEEFDSVFGAASGAGLTLVQPEGRLAITQGDSCTETVVWNPGPALSHQLADMPDDGWRHMLCVEAASIDAPVAVAPGGRWEGWQQLQVLPAA